ncbi:histone deacetylase [Thermoleophilia bacterium SCSIO 60948]|nr:histone deacetylase [Thermoleophilia bacterium SCSIO 60948]
MGVLLRHPSSADHDTGGHPEGADRIVALETVLGGRDWLGLEERLSPAASDAQLERVHSGEHVRAVRELCESGGGYIDGDTIASAGSFAAATHAAGGAVAAVDAVLAGETNWAFSMHRPPGHHAEASTAMGFCLFNSIAVGAAHALAEHGLERILVIDWDVHHGNGTEEIFSASDQVLFASIHQSPLYPGTGPASYIGDGPGEGYTVNMPVAPGAGDAEFLSLLRYVVDPLARAFEPELLMLSAGFDAHTDDPLANCTMSADGFGRLALALRDVAIDLGIPLVACLEGGYDLRALVTSTAAMIGAFEGGGDAGRSDPAFAEPHRRRVAERWRLR